jgi:CHAT domain-containing protein/Flp pilus assembly protein TadD
VITYPRRLLFIVAAVLSTLALCGQSLALDPVAAFLARADSIGAAGGAGALDGFVSGHASVVGAAVGQLVDRALEASAAGGAAAAQGAAQADFALAERLAQSYEKHAGSRVLRDLVGTSRAWDSGQIGLRRQAKDLEKQAAEARGRGDFDGAITSMSGAMKLYEQIGDRRSVAVLWGSLGVAHWSKGDFAAAAEQYEKALAARRAIEDRILEGRTLNGLGSTSYQLGNLDLALAYYRQAVELRRETEDIEGLATSLTYLGNTYLAIGRTPDARTSLEQALVLVRQSGNTVQHYELLTSIASLNAEMGRIARSNESLLEALSLAEAMEDPKREIVCRNNLALNLAEAYRYGEALDQLDALRTLLDEHPDAEQTVVFHRNRGITYMRIGELEWAQDDFDALLDLSEKHRMPVFQLEALINLGYLAAELGELEEGLSYAEKARALAESLNNPKMAREALILAAQVERDLGRFEGSIAKWSTASAMDARDSLDVNMAGDQVGLASVHLLAGRSDEARRILRSMRPVIELTQDGDLAVALDFCMGHSFEKTRPDSARFYYEKGLDLLDQARAEIGGTEVRTGYLGGSRRFYFEEVTTYYAGLARGKGGAEWSALAFRTIERAKARGLLEMLDTSALASGSSEEDALLDSLYRLERSAPDYTERERRLEDQYANLRQERLESYGAGRAEAVIAGPEDIRRILPEGTALLEYALGDTASLLWVIDGRGSKIYRLPRRASLEVAVAQLRDAIAHPMPADGALLLMARRLYADILLPAEDRLKQVKDLVVVPDGILFELPFEVLLTEDPGADRAWDRLPYLARSHSITYAPSASTYLSLHSRPEPRSRRPQPVLDLLAMGDPDYSLLKSLSGRKVTLQPLPQTRREVSDIAAILKGSSVNVHLGREADEATLKAGLRDHSIRVLHLATHGIVDPAEPAASSIALCPDSSDTEDGYLRTLEVVSSSLDVGLVVLSACESARGEIGRGEGVVGFSRAFFAAGARSIVASLWAVSDESTAALMEAFYRHLFTEKQSVARSLNAARLSLVSDGQYAHPYYWSPFVVMGSEYSPW